MVSWGGVGGGELGVNREVVSWGGRQEVVSWGGESGGGELGGSREVVSWGGSGSGAQPSSNVHL